MLLLNPVAWAVPISLLVGLTGAAPAGLIMAPAAEAMALQRRGFGIGYLQGAVELLGAESAGRG